LPYFSKFQSFSQGLIPFNGTPGVHAVYRGIWAVFDNPAGLSQEGAFSAGISYNSRFLMDELSAKAIAVVVPMKKAGNVGFGYQQFGYALYKDQHACLLYSKSFGANIAAGIRFDYLSTAFGGDYGNAAALTGSAGVIVRVSENIRLGATVFNPQRVEFSQDGKERYPGVIQAGMSWNFKGETELAIGISKTVNSKEILQTVFRYQVSKGFLLHGGVSNGHEPFSFGYVFKLSKFEICMASGYHYLLGFSPRFSLIFKK